MNKNFSFSSLQNLTNNIPEIIKHTYHCYSRDEPHQIYNSTDIRLLVREIQHAYDLLSRINDMRHGALGSALISIENEITLEMAHYPQSKFLPRPPNHEQPLRFPQHFIEQSSTIYMQQHHQDDHHQLDYMEKHQLFVLLMLLVLVVVQLHHHTNQPVHLFEVYVSFFVFY